MYGRRDELIDEGYRERMTEPVGASVVPAAPLTDQELAVLDRLIAEAKGDGDTDALTLLESLRASPGRFRAFLAEGEDEGEGESP